MSFNSPASVLAVTAEDPDLLTLLGSLGIGIVTGTALGSILGAGKGATIGGLIGTVGGVLARLFLPGAELFAVLVTVAALTCGLMAGIFFTFSNVVMGSLGRQPQQSGMATMQTLNAAVYNPWFGGIFVLAPAGCALTMIIAMSRPAVPGSAYLLVGGGIYLVGVLLVTALVSVPMLRVLDAAAPSEPASAGLWSTFVVRWTAWNHVRSVTSFLASTSLVVALVQYA